VRLSVVGPITTGFYRVALALPLALVWLQFDRERPHLPLLSLGRPQLLALLGGASLGADLALWHKSFFLTTIANANLLANLMPFLLVPMNMLVTRTFPARLFFYGLLCASVGLVFLVGGKVQFTQESLVGDALAVATAFFYALYLLITGTLREKYSTPSLIFWSSLGCAIFLLPLSLLMEPTMAVTPMTGWFVLVALAVVSQIGGQGVLAYAIAKVGINLSSALILMQPIIAALYAYVLFKEKLTVLEMLGALIILIGIYIAKLGSKKPQPVADSPPIDGSHTEKQGRESI
jgi:drug/metabolite transporter (DMT)-like permease